MLFQCLLAINWLEPGNQTPSVSEWLHGNGVCVGQHSDVRTDKGCNLLLFLLLLSSFLPDHTLFVKQKKITQRQCLGGCFGDLGETLTHCVGRVLFVLYSLYLKFAVTVGLKHTFRFWGSSKICVFTCNPQNFRTMEQNSDLKLIANIYKIFIFIKELHHLHCSFPVQQCVRERQVTFWWQEENYEKWSHFYFCVF